MPTDCSSAVWLSADDSRLGSVAGDLWVLADNDQDFDTPLGIDEVIIDPTVEGFAYDLDMNGCVVNLLIWIVTHLYQFLGHIEFPTIPIRRIRLKRIHLGSSGDPGGGTG